MDWRPWSWLRRVHGRACGFSKHPCGNLYVFNLIGIKEPPAEKLIVTLSKGGFFVNRNQQNRSNRLVVPNVESAIQQMKQEIAQEMNVTLGAETTSRQNGSVGGEITKRLVRMAQQRTQ